MPIFVQTGTEIAASGVRGCPQVQMWPFNDNVVIEPAHSLLSAGQQAPLWVQWSWGLAGAEVFGAGSGPARLAHLCLHLHVGGVGGGSASR